MRSSRERLCPGLRSRETCLCVQGLGSESRCEGDSGDVPQTAVGRGALRIHEVHLGPGEADTRGQTLRVGTTGVRQTGDLQRLCPTDRGQASPCDRVQDGV